VKLILASTSPARRAMLTAAGLDYEAVAPPLDERAAEEPLLAAGISAADLASVLAEAKADSVAEERPGAIVIGSDQTLEFEGLRYTKPESIEEARHQLLAMAGKTHALHSAAAIMEGGETRWRHVDTALLTMRRLTPEEVGRYLARVGTAATRSVGAYQLEGLGVNLFERIEGDHFTILGMPLLPVLAQLRLMGVGL
jgi:septum formation protein